MSYGYQEYSGNPYDATPGSESRYGDQPNPVTQASSNYSQATTPAQGYGAPNPYGTSAGAATSHPPLPQSYGTPAGHQQGAYDAAPDGGAYDNSQGGGYGNTQTTGYGNAQGGYGQPNVVQMPAPRQALSNQEFLQRVEGIRGQIRQLTANVGEIGSVHQRLLSSPDSTHSQLDSLVSQTQILNTQIQDQIRQLEADSLKSGDNTTKKSQIRTLKGHFRTQLEDYQKEEQAYKKRYQDQIAREYRIVNPDASESEVREASEADWGNEGVFQTALKSNRTGAANSVLGNVRARHNDIQRIEKTLVELAQMFNDLAAQVEIQEPQIAQAEEQTKHVNENTEAGNKQLDSGIKHAKTRRKLKWWCFGIIVLIIIILAAVLGGYFGTHQNNKRSLPVLEDAMVRRVVKRSWHA